MAKVMVLEDESILRELLRELLGYEGYQVVAPIDPERLLDEMLAEKPDALILDIHLNGINGLDLLEEIRKNPELKDVYVLATSGMNHAHQARQRGADDFIMKPYMPDELMQLLQNKIKD
jgi:CheY-like chemotaxis protein